MVNKIASHTYRKNTFRRSFLRQVYFLLSYGRDSSSTSSMIMTSDVFIKRFEFERTVGCRVMTNILDTPKQPRTRAAITTHVYRYSICVADVLHKRCRRLDDVHRSVMYQPQSHMHRVCERRRPRSTEHAIPESQRDRRCRRQIALDDVADINTAS